MIEKSQKIVTEGLKNNKRKIQEKVPLEKYSI